MSQTQQDALSSSSMIPSSNLLSPFATALETRDNLTAENERKFFASIFLSYELDPSAYSAVLPTHLASSEHSLIYKVMLEILQEKKHPTVLAVVEALREGSALRAAGGQEYISGLAQETWGMETTEDLGKRVLRHASMRRIEAAARAALSAASGEASIEAAEEETRQLLRSFQAETRLDTYGHSALAGILNGARSAFMPAVRTGWHHLDSRVKFSPGRLITLGARPGVGKTTFSVQMCTQILESDADANVVYCSVEMDAAEIGLKALSCMARRNFVPLVESGEQEKLDIVLQAAGIFANVLERFQIYYGTKLERFVKLAHEIHAQGKLSILVVDFLSSLTPIGDHWSKSDALGSMMKTLKHLAKDLQIPIVVCSQLNRGGAQGKKPTLKDLRDSGEIEQDSDVVLLLHRPEDEEDENGVPINRERLLCLIEKNRFGTMDEIDFKPNLSCHRFDIPSDFSWKTS